MTSPHAIATIMPMEARLAESLPVGPGWGYEPKWDGFRCLA
jgi:ATP-dependent DNA ligase